MAKAIFMIRWWADRVTSGDLWRATAQDGLLLFPISSIDEF